VLDVRNQVRALHLGKRIPRRHVGVVKSTSDGIEEILVGGQGSGWSGAALELGDGEVPRFGIEPHSVFALSVPQIAVTPDTVPAVVVLGVGGVAGQIADVTFYPHPLVFLVRRALCPG